MPRVHRVEKARKDYPDSEIKKGESYFWWKFNFSRFIYRSKTQPRRSQLTQSDFLAQVYDIEDSIEALDPKSDVDDLTSERDEIIDQVRNLGEEQTEKRDNMPESLQESPNAELLQGRADSCEEWVSNLESVDIEEKGEDETDEEFDERKRAFVEELQGYSYDGE